MSKKTPLITYLLIALVLLWSGIFIWQSSYVAIDGSRRSLLFDDSLISLRYSWNLAHGEGLVWNPGERVEGFTSPLWVLLLSLPALFLDKGQLVLSVQILGVFLLLGIGWLSSRLSQTLFRDRPEKMGLGTAALLLPTLYYPLSFLALSGMETGLLTLLVLASLDRLFRKPYSGRVDLPLAFLLALANLTRPDALVFSLGVLIFRVWQAHRGRLSWRGLGLECALVLLPVAGTQLFRWLYFGTLVPNTYQVKVAGIPLGYRLPNGLLYLLQVLPFLVLPLALGLWGNIRSRMPEGWLILSLVLGYVAYTVWVGGDFVPHPRFLIPLVIPLLLFASRGLLEVFRKLRPFPAAVGLLLLTLLAGAPSLPDIVFARPLYLQEWNERNINAAVVLQDVLRPGASVAVTWAGSIPYWTDFRGVDILGKCDPVIARVPFYVIKRKKWWRMPYIPGHNKLDIEYSILGKQPDFVQAFVFTDDDSPELTIAVLAPYLWAAFPGVSILDGLILRGDSPFVDWQALDRIRSPLGLPPPGPLVPF